MTHDQPFDDKSLNGDNTSGSSSEELAVDVNLSVPRWQRVSQAQAQDKILAELNLLRQPVEEAVGRLSRWNGVLVVDSTIDDNALLQRDGTIKVKPELTFQKARWRTWIHELVHSCGERVQPGEYMVDRGWEEGPVEVIQRSIRPAVMQQLQANYGILDTSTGIMVAYDENHIQSVEAFWPFNDYVRTFTEISDIIESDPFTLAIEAISRPISSRGIWASRKALVKGKLAVLEISRLSAKLRTQLPMLPQTAEEHRLLHEEEESDGEDN